MTSYGNADGPAGRSAGPRVLVVTNDFPPRPGGIQAFVAEVVRRLPPDDVVVLTSADPGAAAFDREQPFTVHRIGHYPMLPTPRVAALARGLIAEHGLTAAWFGAAAPLALLAPAVRRAGARRVVATTHGHEVGWAALPVARSALGRIGAGVDVLTYLGDYTRARIAPAVGPGVRLERLTPGVDLAAFHPGVSGDAVRRSHGLVGRPVVVCVSRLVPRKGQDVLIRALPAIRRRVPDAALLLVGDGPDRSRLAALAAQCRVREHVAFAGAVPWADLPAHFAAGDVFAMPCRTRRMGMDVEGLGIVYLEASACGLPVVAGKSGGAPDAVLEGRTGVVVDGGDVDEVAAAVAGALDDPIRAAQLGAAGRSWVESTWGWDAIAERLRSWLAEPRDADHRQDQLRGGGVGKGA